MAGWGKGGGGGSYGTNEAAKEILSRISDCLCQDQFPSHLPIGPPQPFSIFDNW